MPHSPNGSRLGLFAAPRQGLRNALFFAIALSLCNAAAGGTFLTATGSSTIAYYNWNIPLGSFGSFYDYFALASSCGATACVSTPLGNYTFNTSNNYFLSNLGDGAPAKQIANGVYFEQLVPFPGGSLGNTLSMDSISGGPYLLSATVSGFSVYATPATTNAVIELNLTGVTSQVIAGLPSTLYLDIAGTTSSPITLTTVPLSPAVILIDPFTLDWTATLSDTRFGGTSSSVPEPSTYALLLTGLVSLCWNAHRRKDWDEGARAG